MICIPALLDLTGAANAVLDAEDDGTAEYIGALNTFMALTGLERSDAYELARQVAKANPGALAATLMRRGLQ